jgi:hypothetical protein
MRIWALSLALLAAASLHGDPTKQYICLDGTRLLSRPAAFSRAVKILKKGTAVMAEDPKNGYVKVSVDDDTSGYLSVRSLQAHKPKLTADAKASGDASAEEVAAATKGFNKQIEAKLRSQGDNEKNYAKLDKLIARSTVADPEGSLEDFRQAGRLGEFKQGGE